MANAFTLTQDDFRRLGPLMPKELVDVFTEGHGDDVELVPRVFIWKYAEHIATSEFTQTSKYFTGPGGVGKTTSLVFLTTIIMRMSETREDPCIVIYESQCSMLVKMNPADACAKLIDTLLSLNASSFERCAKFAALKLVLEDPMRSSTDKWDYFVTEYRRNKWRVFCALDQWNMLFESDMDKSHPLCMFKRLVTGSTLIIFAAVSSSFSVSSAHKDAFHDAEAGNCQVRIFPLTVEEGNVLLEIWRHRSQTLQLTPDEMSVLIKRTGGIPRLLQIYYTTTIATNYPDQFDMQCKEYYDVRLNRLMARWESDPIQKYRFIEDMADIYMLRSVRKSSDTLDKLWVQTGLLYEIPQNALNPARLKTVNEFVTLTVSDAIRNKAVETIRTLARGDSTCWRAYELFVSFSLQISGPIRLVYTDLRNENRGDLTVHAVKSVPISKEASLNPEEFLIQCGGPIEKGTLLVLWEGHFVTDLVLFADAYSSNGTHESILFFIQISASSYSDHTTHLPNLGTVYPNWSYNILETYQTLYGLPRNSGNVSTGKMPKNTRYVYITPNESIMKKTAKMSGHDVLRVSKNNMRLLNPDLWRMAGLE